MGGGRNLGRSVDLAKVLDVKICLHLSVVRHKLEGREYPSAGWVSWQGVPSVL